MAFKEFQFSLCVTNINNLIVLFFFLFICYGLLRLTCHKISLFDFIQFDVIIIGGGIAVMFTFLLNSIVFLCVCVLHVSTNLQTIFNFCNCLLCHHTGILLQPMKSCSESRALNEEEKNLKPYDLLLFQFLSMMKKKFNKIE